MMPNFLENVDRDDLIQFKPYCKYRHKDGQKCEFCPIQKQCKQIMDDIFDHFPWEWTANDIEYLNKRIGTEL